MKEQRAYARCTVTPKGERAIVGGHPWVYEGEVVSLEGDWGLRPLPPDHRRLLLLQPIPEKQRVADDSLLEQGIAAGKAAEAAGREYHPAANAAFDRLTGGHSSRIQLQSLIANARLAARLTGDN